MSHAIYLHRNYFHPLGTILDQKHIHIPNHVPTGISRQVQSVQLATQLYIHVHSEYMRDDNTPPES